MTKRKNNINEIIYSTNSDFEFEHDTIKHEKIDVEEQNLKVHIEKRKSGKISVIVKNFIGENQDLKMLGKILKIKCGVGGSVKNGEIIIQGNIRDKVIKILDQIGYNSTKVGG